MQKEQRRQPADTTTPIETLLHDWLQRRQELTVLYVAVDGLRQFTPKKVPITIKVQALCQALLDYLCAGHFKVFERLIEEFEHHDADSRALAARLLRQIDRSTAAAIAFNDIYDTEAHCAELLDALAADLSRLGLVLAERFELEDQLIERLQQRQPQPSMA